MTKSLAAILLLVVVGSSGCTDIPKPQCPPLAYARSVVDPSTRSSYFELFRQDVDGCGETQLTSTPGKNNLAPSWSPDGKRIVFSSRRDGDDEIYVMNLDGSGLLKLTDNSYEDSDPTWSSDGSNRVAFSSLRNGTRGIYVMRIDGTGEHALSAQDDYRPAWSPDGTRIAFVSKRGGLRRIFAMNDDGTLQHGITASGNNNDPTWSPQGTKILFTSNFGLWVKEFFDVSAPKLLFQGGSEPTWSPDGTQIAFVRLDNNRNKLSVMQGDGTGLRDTVDWGSEQIVDTAWRPGQ